MVFLLDELCCSTTTKQKKSFGYGTPQNKGIEQDEPKSSGNIIINITTSETFDLSTAPASVVVDEIYQPEEAV